MTKTRLTQDDREAIADAIIAHKYAPIDKAFRREENALAEEYRVSAHGDYLKTMEEAPNGAFDTVAHMSLAVDGRWYRLHFGGDYPNQIYRRTFAKYTNKLPDTDPLSVRIADWANRLAASKPERKDLRAKTKGTLGSFRTFDALLEAWPEAERFITERWRTRATYVSNVPAVTFKALSEALDLPPEGEDEPASVAA